MHSYKLCGFTFFVSSESLTLSHYVYWVAIFAQVFTPPYPHHGSLLGKPQQTLQCPSAGGLGHVTCFHWENVSGSKTMPILSYKHHVFLFFPVNLRHPPREEQASDSHWPQNKRPLQPTWAQRTAWDRTPLADQQNNDPEIKHCYFKPMRFRVWLLGCITAKPDWYTLLEVCSDL